VAITSIEKNKSIIRRYYDELWNSWNLELADELISAEVSFRGSLGIVVQGRASFCDYVRFFHNAIEELVAEGDKVVGRLSYTGTHLGELFGIPATGRQVTYPGVAIFRITDGRIVEGWVLGDTRGMMQQLEERLPPKEP
jgi:predicted ester cyclase